MFTTTAKTNESIEQEKSAIDGLLLANERGDNKPALQQLQRAHTQFVESLPCPVCSTVTPRSTEARTSGEEQPKQAALDGVARRVTTEHAAVVELPPNTQQRPAACRRRKRTETENCPTEPVNGKAVGWFRKRKNRNLVSHSFHSQPFISNLFKKKLELVG